MKRALVRCVLLCCSGACTVASAQPGAPGAWPGTGSIPAAPAAAASKPAFTPAERRWIAAHLVIRLGADPVYPPYSSVDADGVLEGLAADYVRLAAERSGLDLRLQPNLSWQQILDGTRTGSIDMIAAAADTPARRTFLRFTQPYITFPTAIITRVDGPYVAGLASLADRRLAVVRGFSINELIMRDHPRITLVETGSLAESLAAVDARRADAMVGNLESTGRMVSERYLGTLKVAATVPESPNTLSFGVRADWPELQSILDKSLATITPAEHDTIRQRWLTVRFHEGVALQRVLITAAPFVLALAAIIIVMLISNRRLKRQVALTKSAEHQITYQLALQEALIDTIPNPIFYKDGQGRYLGVNRAYEEAFGLKRAQLIGKTSVEVPLLTPELRQAVHNYDLELIAQQKPARSRESRMLYVDGTPHHLMSTATVFKLPGGEPGGMIGSLTDITGLKQHEAELAEARDRALDATRAKSSFLAAMSHEIRTPMNGVIGVLELLDGPSLSPQQRQAAGVARESAQSLLALLNDILDFSKIEAGRMELDLAPASLGSLIRNAAGVFEPLARAKDLQFRVEVDLPDNAFHQCDALRIKQIVFNLLSNAIKFTAHGGITLTLRAGPTGGATQRIDIEVTDTGIGITPDQLNQLFAPFSQAAASTSRQYGGTGLGLSISRRLTALMGGSLLLEPGADGGTRAHFSAGFAAAEAPVPTAGSVAGTLHKVTGLKVLAADDHSANRLVIDAQLQRLECDAVVVEDGMAALQEWRAARTAKAPFDCLVLDCNMPVLDGFETARRIRAEEAGTAHVRILALTADARDETRDACLAAGMDEVLVKPLDLAALSAALAGQASHPLAAPLSAAAEAPAVDIARFEDGMGSRAQALPLMQAFLDCTVDDLAALLAALPGATFPHPAITSIAHRIKGAALTIHAPALAASAEALEVAARGAAAFDASTMVDLIKRDFAAIEAVLRGYLAAAQDRGHP